METESTQMTIDQQIDFLTEKLAKASRAIDRLPVVLPAPPAQAVPEPRSVVEFLRARQETLAAQRGAGLNRAAARAAGGR